MHSSAHVFIISCTTQQCWNHSERACSVGLSWLSARGVCAADRSCLISALWTAGAEESLSWVAGSSSHGTFFQLLGVCLNMKSNQ
ncbi:hypothetical protein EV356DRAFT_361812 [Viridothelium virens]|uniref:Uncharacterized protein n=1 Tax=Viridothelium virens TaxID=1048519 RepID=A0A6A6HIN0_VIRVR|nr:hypothetical protein EV356DRAFT_361812 [Viridothelium virens]